MTTPTLNAEIRDRLIPSLRTDAMANKIENLSDRLSVACVMANTHRNESLTQLAIDMKLPEELLRTILAEGLAKWHGELTTDGFILNTIVDHAKAELVATTPKRRRAAASLTK